MKDKKMMKTFLFAMATTLLLVSCSPKLKPLKENNFAVTPRPLVVAGDKIEANFDAIIPAKWMNKKAVVSLMPVLRYGSNEAWGATSTIQGEKVLDNNPIVSYDAGGRHTFKSSFEYNKRMTSPKLYMTFRANVKGKKVDLPEVLLSEGLITTATLASISGAMPYYAHNAFQRIVEDKYEANIQFLIQQAGIRNSELTKKELKEWNDRVNKATHQVNQRVAVEVQAYASPDGGVKLNEKLSQQREKNTTSLLKKKLIKTGKTEVPFTAHYTAQDWVGFKKYVESSKIQDKELILRILSMYEDPEEREREIRNISVVFDELATDILPKLRRSRLLATIETIGKSDDELSSLLKSTPEKLNVEELLYAIELQPDPAQEQYLRRAMTLFPKDARSYNNLASKMIEKGNLEEAQKLLSQAEQINPLAEISLNKALIALEMGKLIDAETLLGNTLTTERSQEALGFLYLKKGDFDKAVKAYTETISNNAAIAYIMVQDYRKAMDILDKVTQPNATTDYLRAIVAARQGDALGASNFLKEAFRKDASIRGYAHNDVEFEVVKKNKNFTVTL